MKNIIVPTDFSATAKNAYVYAKALTKKLRGQLKIIHYWHPDIDVVSGNVSNASNFSMNELMKIRAAELENFVQSDEASEQELLESEVVAGFVASSLEEVSKKKEIDLIVMGTNGKSGLMGKIFGSISSQVSQQAHCPVCLVPPKAKFNGIKNVIYASDYDYVDNEVIRQIVHFATKLKANIHLVHVSKDGKTKKTEEMKYVFDEFGTSEKFSLSTIHNDSVWEGLDDFARRHEMDLMVLVTRHRSFWEQLRHKSQSKAIISHINIPIIIMHTDDKA